MTTSFMREGETIKREVNLVNHGSDDDKGQRDYEDEYMACEEVHVEES